MLIALMLACDADSTSLDPDIVTSIAPGDAVGSTWSGSYAAEIYTTACEGMCGPVEYGLFQLTFCDVGQVDTEYLQVEQVDGALTISLNDPISRYTGAIFADDAVEVGGYATDYGGAVEMAARVEGRFSGEGLDATAHARVWGQLGETIIDCESWHDVEAPAY